jgi:hypothetical protein
MPKKKQVESIPEFHNILPDLKPLAFPVGLINVDPANPRTGHDVTGIAKSLESYGQRKPIVVNKKNNLIEAGTGTYRAATEILQWTHIATVFVEDEAGTQSGYNLADNRLTDLSFFDPEKFIEMMMSVDEIVPGTETIRDMILFVEDEPPFESEEEEDPKEFTQSIVFDISPDIYNRFILIKNRLKLKDDNITFLRMIEYTEKQLGL